jgi:hypothetical protein
MLYIITANSLKEIKLGNIPLPKAVFWQELHHPIIGSKLIFALFLGPTTLLNKVNI